MSNNTEEIKHESSNDNIIDGIYEEVRNFEQENLAITKFKKDESNYSRTLQTTDNSIVINFDVKKEKDNEVRNRIRKYLEE